MRPCLMVVIMIMIIVNWLVNLMMPFINHWIQGCLGGPDNERDDQDPHGGHVMVSSDGVDSMDISDEPSQEHEHVHGGDSISGYETKVPCLEVNENSISGEMQSQGSRRDSISGLDAKLSYGDDEPAQGSRRDSVFGLEGEDK